MVLPVPAQTRVHVYVGISDFVVRRAVTHDKQEDIACRAIDKAVGVASTSWKTCAHARSKSLRPCIGFQHDLSLQNDYELVLPGMGVPIGRLATWNNPRQVDAEISQAGMIPEASVVAFLVDRAMRLRRRPRASPLRVLCRAE